MNKEQQIEEIAKIVFDYVDSKGQKRVYILGNDTAKEMREYSHNQGIAEEIYNAAYRKTFTSEIASDTQKAYKEGYEKGFADGRATSERDKVNCIGCAHVKENAVKDFAEVLKEKCRQNYQTMDDDAVWTVDIDELLKEF